MNEINDGHAWYEGPLPCAGYYFFEHQSDSVWAGETRAGGLVYESPSLTAPPTTKDRWRPDLDRMTEEQARHFGTQRVEEVELLRKPVQRVVDELSSMLADAKAGRLRGFAFVGLYVGTSTYRYGMAGDYSMPEYAMALKLMELEFDTIVMSEREDDG
jgi:hypothetical protein